MCLSLLKTSTFSFSGMAALPLGAMSEIMSFKTTGRKCKKVPELPFEAPHFESHFLDALVLDELHTLLLEILQAAARDRCAAMRASSKGLPPSTFVEVTDDVPAVANGREGG